MEPTEYRIEFAIQRRRAGEADFTEIGFGSSGAWETLDACTHSLDSGVTNGEWETEGDMPDPDDVMREIRGERPVNRDELITAAFANVEHLAQRVTPAYVGQIIDAVLPLIEADLRESIAAEIEAERPHIPVSTDPKRNDRIIQRSAFNRAARIVRGATTDTTNQTG